MQVSVIIPAAGVGRRMGGDAPKQYLELSGRPLICHTLDCFRSFADVVMAVEPLRLDEVRRDIFQAYHYPASWRIVAGGEKRQDSVRFAFSAVAASAEVVLVHDGVRPFVSAAVIGQVVNRTVEVGAAIVAAAVKDTIKRAKQGVITATVDRSDLWQAQTPQGFRRDILERALAAAMRDGFYGTDEASLVERLGLPVAIVCGDERNIKITTPEDLLIAEAMVRSA